MGGQKKNVTIITKKCKKNYYTLKVYQNGTLFLIFASIPKNFRIMMTVSAREFRANQKSFLDMAARGLEILITRKNDVFTLSKVKEDDTLMSKKDFTNKVEKAVSEVRSGRAYKMKAGESLEAFMDRMEREGNV